MRSPGRFLLFVLLVIVGVKLSEQAYALVAFRDERAQARDLRTRLGETGVDLVFARSREDSLRTLIKAQDSELERDLLVVRRFHREARQGMTPQRHAEYSAELARYNARVVARNEVLRRFEALHDRHQAAATRYNLLADSLHALAVKMGQPYYQVPTALEAAEEHRRREVGTDGP
jgi:hypothetical protein